MYLLIYGVVSCRSQLEVVVSLRPRLLGSPPLFDYGLAFGGLRTALLGEFQSLLRGAIFLLRAEFQMRTAILSRHHNLFLFIDSQREWRLCVDVVRRKAIILVLVGPSWIPSRGQEEVNSCEVCRYYVREIAIVTVLQGLGELRGVPEGAKVKGAVDDEVESTGAVE